MRHIAWMMFLISYYNFINGYSKRIVLLKKLEQCRNIDDLPIILSDFVVYQESKGDYILRGNIEIKKDIPRDWVAKIEMYKCSDGYNPNSCEIYLDNLRTHNGCDIMEQLLVHYKNVFTAIIPKLNCPMKAGIYKLENCHINKYMKYLLTHGSIPSIVIKAEGLYKGDPLFCFESRFDLTNRHFNITENI